MFAHVDKGEGLLGGVQRPLHHVLGGPDKGVDGAVGGRAGVHVQQAAAGGAADRRGDGIDDLGHEKCGWERWKVQSFRFRALICRF